MMTEITTTTHNTKIISNTNLSNFIRFTKNQIDDLNKCGAIEILQHRHHPIRKWAKKCGVEFVSIKEASGLDWN